MVTTKFDVVIIGGGCGGVAAGIQSARLGIKTLIVEETPWLGGMITSAGVSAFDGNKYALGGGIFGELRKKIEDYYGGTDKTFTGWISLTCFEPKIGKKFLHELAEQESNLTIWFETSLHEVLRENDAVYGVRLNMKDGHMDEVHTKIVIEATEYGDVLKEGNIPYRLGRDSKSDTGEIDAPYEHDFEVQDITFCAILKKYSGEAPKVTPSENYKYRKFKNSTAEDSNSNDENYLNHKLHNWESFISYAALPNKKYLLNWPFRANDYPTTEDIYENKKSRKLHYKKAKELTLDYVHYIQTKLGHPEWGLATDEFPTDDSLPFIPYVRESRRVKGKVLLKEEDVIPTKKSFRPKLQKESIAVGDYFLDHHHSKFFVEPDERLVEPLPANAPFQIPLGCLIPQNVKGLIVAEKSISVTHIVNGCSRLQPVVMLTGQAAGALAALAVKNKCNPEDVKHGEVQSVLLDAGCQLFPYKDVWNTDSLFIPTQKLALMGIYVDDEDFAFNADKTVSSDELNKYLSHLDDEKTKNKLISLTGKTRREVFNELYAVLFH
ncbi:MAG: FAD-dependent oxidoreductase [Ignavibacteriaceae bacterium]|nr:FAD-dependent oxidoreductase [Ignavibacteriaceae bacterium]